jgi:hypothetical protein
MKKLTSLIPALKSILFVVVLFSCSRDEFSYDPGKLDTQLPSIIIQSPTTDPSYSTIEGNLSFSGSAQDDNNLKTIQWSLNDGPKNEATGKNDWSVNDVSLTQGDNIFVAFAEDESNNIFSDTLIITKNKYLIFLGVPRLNPLGVFIDQPTEVKISVQIASDNNLISNSVMLIEVDENNNEVNTICPLSDNGNLANGDDINGDNVFSGIYNFTLSKSKRLRVKAKTSENEGEIEGFSAIFVLKAFKPVSSASLTEVVNTLDNTVDKLNESIQINDFNSTMQKTVGWLKTLSYVKGAELVNGNIKIHFTSGLSSGMIINNVSSDGSMTQGGYTQIQGEIRKSTIPVNKQTRGENKLMTESKIHSKSGTNDEIILDKDVFIYEPFEAIFDPFDKGDAVKNEFNKSTFEFNIVHLKNQECTIEALEKLTDYGYIYIDTHGDSGEWFLTGQIYNEADDYGLLIREGKLTLYQNIEYKDNVFGKVTGTATMYAVSNEYIESLNGTFPNSIIFNSSCQSSMTNFLSNAFLSKGAKTYIGFDKTSYSDFLKTVSVEFARKIVIDGNNTGTVFNGLSVTQDDNSPYANIEITGSQKMHYSNSLINGDFEYGDLTGWTQEGDGRVITQLVSLTPPQNFYMGIISTGLGYTTTSGQISQSFKVDAGMSNIKISWNFLSEEFLEYVGSIYQDYLKIIIREGSTENVMFSRTIDEFAAGYNLIKVSPEIVFDRGDVYMTDWQELNIDISNYAGKNVTLIIQVGDVGDSIYDSAVLLDEIALE